MTLATDYGPTSARYKRIPAKGIYLPNSPCFGFNKYLVQSGDLIKYREADCNRLARALDLVTHGHDGKTGI